MCIRDREGKNLYRVLRDCNIFLENIGKLPDMDVSEKERWICEVKFLKAYYHYWLVRMYGPIPLVKENISVDAPTAVSYTHLPKAGSFINIDVIDISGKTVCSAIDGKNAINGIITISLQERGIFLVSIRTDKGRFVRKVINL